jgi:hypothetical protein
MQCGQSRTDFLFNIFPKPTFASVSITAVNPAWPASTAAAAAAWKETKSKVSCRKFIRQLFSLRITVEHFVNASGGSTSKAFLEVVEAVTVHEAGGAGHDPGDDVGVEVVNL